MKGDTQILKINEDERNRNIHFINLYHGKKASKKERKNQMQSWQTKIIKFST